MPDPVPVMRDHKKLGDELDDVYIETVHAASSGRGYLKDRKGNINVVFFQFYYPFVELFQHTVHMREMKDLADADLIKSIENWIQDEEKPKMGSLREGITLFSRYQKELLHRSVIQIKKE